jgi:ankyrin repeat protein
VALRRILLIGLGVVVLAVAAWLWSQTTPEASGPTVLPGTSADRPVPERPAGESTPLHTAAMLGQEDTVRGLLGDGAVVDARDAFGATPLHRAAGMGHANVVELLLANGAAVDAVQLQGWTPLHAAASRGRLAVVRILLDHRADVDAADDEGKTPLHLTAEKKLMAETADMLRLADVAGLLLANGADPTARTSAGMTPLELALRTRNTPVAEVLQKQDGGG